MKEHLSRAALALFLLSASQLSSSSAADESLSVSQPARDNTSAGCQVVIRGRAILKPGHHVWIVAARKNFADLGLIWLQGEAEVDPTTGDYLLPVTLGVPDDVGSTFRVSAAILDDATHNRMRSKLVVMMSTDRHLPMAFPTTSTPPVHRLVKKVSHDGC